MLNDSDIEDVNDRIAVIKEHFERQGFSVDFVKGEDRVDFRLNKDSKTYFVAAKIGGSGKYELAEPNEAAFAKARAQVQLRPKGEVIFELTDDTHLLDDIGQILGGTYAQFVGAVTERVYEMLMAQVKEQVSSLLSDVGNQPDRKIVQELSLTPFEAMSDLLGEGRYAFQVNFAWWPERKVGVIAVTQLDIDYELEDGEKVTQSFNYIKPVVLATVETSGAAGRQTGEVAQATQVASAKLPTGDSGGMIAKHIRDAEDALKEKDFSSALKYAQQAIYLITKIRTELIESGVDPDNITTEDSDKIGEVLDLYNDPDKGIYTDPTEFSEATLQAVWAIITQAQIVLAETIVVRGAMRGAVIPLGVLDETTISRYQRNAEVFADEVIRRLQSQLGLSGESFENYINKHLRPGKDSLSGFIGHNEDLRQLLIDDYITVYAAGYTHEELAGWLEQLSGAGSEFRTFNINGQTLRVKKVAYRKAKATQPDVFAPATMAKTEPQATRGSQESPLGDKASTNVDYIVEDLTTGKRITFSGLMKGYIKNYGFYEGHNDSGEDLGYRLNPADIIEIFTGNRPATAPVRSVGKISQIPVVTSVSPPKPKVAPVALPKPVTVSPAPKPTVVPTLTPVSSVTSSEDFAAIEEKLKVAMQDGKYNTDYAVASRVSSLLMDLIRAATTIEELDRAKAIWEELKQGGKAIQNYVSGRMSQGILEAVREKRTQLLAMSSAVSTGEAGVITTYEQANQAVIILSNLHHYLGIPDSPNVTGDARAINLIRKKFTATITRGGGYATFRYNNTLILQRQMMLRFPGGTFDVNYDEGYGVFLIDENTVILQTLDGRFKITRSEIQGQREFRFTIEMLTTPTPAVAQRDYNMPLTDAPAMTYEEHERTIDTLLALSHDPATDEWIEVKQVTDMNDPIVNMAYNFLGAVSIQEHMEGNNDLSSLMERLINGELPQPEGRSVPGLFRVYIHDPTKLSEELRPVHHASDRGIHIIAKLGENVTAKLFGGALEAAALVHEFISFLGQPPEVSVAFDVVFRGWQMVIMQTGSGRYTDDIIRDKRSQSAFRNNLARELGIGEEDLPPDLTLETAFNKGIENMKQYLAEHEGIREPDLLARLSQAEQETTQAVRDYTASGAAGRQAGEVSQTAPRADWAREVYARVAESGTVKEYLQMIATGMSGNVTIESSADTLASAPDLMHTTETVSRTGKKLGLGIYVEQKKSETSAEDLKQALGLPGDMEIAVVEGVSSIKTVDDVRRILTEKREGTRVIITDVLTDDEAIGLEGALEGEKLDTNVFIVIRRGWQEGEPLFLSWVLSEHLLRENSQHVIRLLPPQVGIVPSHGSEFRTYREQVKQI